MVSFCQVLVVFGSGEDWQCSNMKKRETARKKRIFKRSKKRNKDSKTREMSENKGRYKIIYQKRERIKETISEQMRGKE